MKVLLDIKDDKVPFMMEVLKNFKFVKAEPIMEEKKQLVDEIKEAVQNLKLVRAGKLKARPAKELLNGTLAFFPYRLLISN